IVSKVIALGSPFHGTKISVFGVGFTATQLLPNSSVLNNLRSLMTISNTDYYCVVTNCDHMILPWDSAIVDNISYDVVEDIGHLQLIYSKVVLELVEANINLNQGTINNECLDSDKDASFN
ncbi:MAG: hypothetical protein HOI53_06540, partial [Francisellaceae bacterium]|nr:hypothetical protein [Francisellaceae bacterium]